MITLVRDKFGEDSTTATQVTDAQILKFLNERQKEIAADTDVLVSAWTASTVQNQQHYTVPPEYTSVEAIAIYKTAGNLQKQWLSKVSVTDLDPTLATGQPLRFAPWGANSGGDNSPTFSLDPIPNENGSSDMTCYGRQLPKTMVSGGQGPEVRERWQFACVNGAVADCYLRVAPGKPEVLALHDRYAAKWAAAKEAASELAMLEAYSPTPARDTMGYTRPNW